LPQDVDCYFFEIELLNELAAWVGVSTFENRPGLVIGITTQDRLGRNAERADSQSWQCQSKNCARGFVFLANKLLDDLTV
jgi:hypothetical protein